MKIIRDQAALLVIDMQPKLLAVMDQSEVLIKWAIWLVKAARKLNMPIVFSEQYPEGLGATIADLSEITKEALRFEKMSFSCLDDEAIKVALKPFSQIIVIGIESHICVLQTALDLLHEDTCKEVFVIESAIASRNPKDKEIAIERMRAAGACIISAEMFLCECLKTAAHPEFSEFSKEFLRKTPESV